MTWITPYDRPERGNRESCHSHDVRCWVWEERLRYQLQDLPKRRARPPATPAGINHTGPGGSTSTGAE